LADDPNRFMPRITEVISADGNRLALNLVGPARVIAVAAEDKRKIRGKRDVPRLPVVQRLKGS